MNINLREEETNQYISFYQGYLEEIQLLNKKVTDVLNGIMNQSKYEKLQRKISDIIDAYTEMIVNNIETGVFSTWQESQGSLRACLRTYRAGDAADEVCVQIEQKMGDLMIDILKIEKEDLIITERPIVSEDGLEQLEDICRTAQSEMQNIKAEYLAQDANRESDNDIYGTLRTLIEGVAANMESFFEEAFKSFAELHGFVRSISAQLHDIAEENGAGNRTGNEAGGSTSNQQFDTEVIDSLDDYLFKYITETVLGKTVLYNNSIWYKAYHRQTEWLSAEKTRINERDNYIREQLRGLDISKKEEWKYVIEHRNETSGINGYETEKGYLEEVKLIGDNEPVKMLSTVEQARLAQGSFKVGQHINQYSGRYNYTFDTLDEDTKLYKMQTSEERESGNYFFSEKEYLKLCKKTPAEIYDSLQLGAFYGKEDDGNLEHGFKKIFMEYVVKTGKKIDVARGMIEANEHLTVNPNAERIEQIFVPSEEFDKLIDFEFKEVESDYNSDLIEFKGRIQVLATNLANQEKRKDLRAFKELTQFLDDTIFKEYGKKKRVLSYTMIQQIMPVYKKFYSEYGSILKDRFSKYEEREEYVRREYISVTRERNNDQYFEGDEVWTFKSLACRTYTVFDRIADMMKNVAMKCKSGAADDTNLTYAAYVLFDPILQGHLNDSDRNKYAKFSRWASDEILKIFRIGAEDKNTVTANDKSEDAELDLSDEKFNEENTKLYIFVVEKIVEQMGGDELNKAVEKNYDNLTANRAISSHRASKIAVPRRQSHQENTYGRYTVTNKSIQMMASVCARANVILDPIDKFYKDKFEKMNNGYKKANEIIHDISAVTVRWGLGTWNLSKLFSKDDSASTILEKVQLGGVALANFTTAGKIINGGAYLIKVLDWVMPHMKKSRLLVKLSEKVWNLTRQEISSPELNNGADQYLMEHYEIKYGMTKGQSGRFEYIHRVTAKIEDDYQRRTFENAVFSADMILTPQNYLILETDPLKCRAIFLGVFLNLTRSGMSSRQNIECGTANDIVDKLYDIYVSSESIKPRVDINPDSRKLR